ncbi:HTH-type transcriptional repressor FabR [Patulibacter sp. NPDC049589]|uniref:HTH-type transcriptional repressor FabR n=1 Tax=Patulibacter sp. NPDC049589 TaxID=3154731 RepID=UPI00343E8A79
MTGSKRDGPAGPGALRLVESTPADDVAAGRGPAPAAAATTAAATATTPAATATTATTPAATATTPAATATTPAATATTATTPAATATTPAATTSDRSDDDAPLTRQERKLRTRNALLDAALDQLESRSFGAISLREVSRAAGITPTAFYRHFESMEELGLVLVDESFASLREMMRAGRAEAQAPGDDIRASAATLVRHVGTHQSHYRFIARERSGGIASLRAAIAREIQSFSNELADDLRRYPVLEDLDQPSLELVAGLIVTVMVATAERLLDAPPGAEDAIRHNTVNQMRLIVLGSLRWNRD